MDQMEKLLRLTKENNEMLKQIVTYLATTHTSTEDRLLQSFSVNMIADLLGNKIHG